MSTLPLLQRKRGLVGVQHEWLKNFKGPVKILEKKEN
jgi:hypothetical protein